jgi:chorismate lyase / 3-hydroxybenzoate synthase
MILSSGNILPGDVDTEALPLWVCSLLKFPQQPAKEQGGGIWISVAQSEHFSLVSARLSGARELLPEELQQRVCDAYHQIAASLAQTSSPHPVRFWNIIPDIHRPAGDGTDRYMIFNAGRFRALAEWFGGAEAFARLVPAASGVGHDGDDLVIHALGASAPGEPMSNPRQIAPYRYSRRFGPLPPCFARATLVRNQREPSLLLVGGTASIRGEDSVHPQSLRQQTLETLENLACLVATACNAEYQSNQQAAWLAFYRHLRIYYPRAVDRRPIAELLNESFTYRPQMEFVRANLCRSELLVEIEGVANVDAVPASTI